MQGTAKATCWTSFSCRADRGTPGCEHRARLRLKEERGVRTIPLHAGKHELEHRAYEVKPRRGWKSRDFAQFHKRRAAIEKR